MAAQLSLSDVIWVTAAVGQFAVLLLLIARKLVREFPVFFAFLCFHVLLTLLLWWFRPYFSVPFSRYFYTFWVGQALDAVLRFAIVHELFARVFRRYRGLQRLGDMTLRAGAAILVVAAFVVAGALAHPDPNKIMDVIFVLDRSTSVVQCGLVFLLFLLASQLRMFLRPQVVGIALGFGVLACIDLTVGGLRTHFGPAVDVLLSYVRRSAYLCALAVWLACLARREPAVHVAHSLPHNNLAEWNRALLQLLNS
jgi:hypothetical protein